MTRQELGGFCPGICRRIGVVVPACRVRECVPDARVYVNFVVLSQPLQRLAECLNTRNFDTGVFGREQPQDRYIERTELLLIGRYLSLVDYARIQILGVQLRRSE